MPLKPSAQKVQDALRSAGFDNAVVELPDSARTAAEAAAAVGCEVGQIVKSLLFRAEPSGRAVLVAASGRHRVDEQAVAAVVGERIGRATPDFVRAQTGFAIGGVPPTATRRRSSRWWTRRSSGTSGSGPRRGTRTRSSRSRRRSWCA
jgi:prolyl-tRNA editing enzyme YbaK/EbsC (Cys-tRNA(Pro) deacylase)